jgi:hypothetical protein
VKIAVRTVPITAAAMTLVDPDPCDEPFAPLWPASYADLDRALRRFPGRPAGLDGAESGTGDVTWSDTAGTLTISGIGLIHHTVPVTITVPDSYGNYTEPSSDMMTPNLITGGTAQIQVAP